MAQYIYGKNMVMQRLNSGKSVGKLFLLEGMKDQNLIQAAKKANCKVEWLNRKKLDAMAEGGGGHPPRHRYEDQRDRAADERRSRRKGSGDHLHRYPALRCRSCSRSNCFCCSPAQ